MLSPAESQSRPPQPDAALAFLFAPGVAAIVAAVVISVMAGLDPSPAHEGAGVMVLTAFVGSSVAFGFVGYATAAIVGVPVYLLLPERARSCFAVVVPLTGMVAAAPWLLLEATWLRGGVDLSFVGIAFALGCVAGIAFLFIRRPRDAGGRDDAAEGRRRPPAP